MLFQNVNINSLSLLVIYSSNIPNYTTSTLITISISCSIFDASRYSTKIAYFESLFIITKIESYTTPISSSFDFSSLFIKSIVTIY